MTTYTPLWPAGHLPHKGGDRFAAGYPLQPKRFCERNAPVETPSVPHPFSPLVGEMPGRAEGGDLSLNAISQEA
ncbi:hypothetical protein FKV68_19025 [Sinorhizobium mexicanum]|uniref:Lytic murein transglycosylase n=1 Tax=Sinorhizobium mexicanum TaxID=375549 RepID=A0A859QTM2_9HYPH|nr:hypothetical protein FKV68_19025 [Sinorhizobium mexicanum]